MKSRTVTIIFSLFFFYGCYDIFRSIEQKIVGNISVIDSNDEEGGRFGLVIYDEKEEFNQSVVGDYIADIVGNDSVLLVQGIRPRVCNEVFYRISHNKGMKPIEVTEIGYEKYKELRSSLRAIYFFHADETKCP